MTSESETNEEQLGLSDEDIRLHTEYTQALVTAIAEALNAHLKDKPAPIINTDFIASAISGALAHVEFDVIRACGMSMTYFISLLRNRAQMYENAVRDGKLTEREAPPAIDVVYVKGPTIDF